jgi:hypothetical protein
VEQQAPQQKGKVQKALKIKAFSSSSFTYGIRLAMILFLI